MPYFSLVVDSKGNYTYVLYAPSQSHKEADVGRKFSKENRMKNMHIELAFGINIILSAYMLCFSGLLRYYCQKEPVIGIVKLLSVYGSYYFIFLLVMIIFYVTSRRLFLKYISLYYLIPFIFLCVTLLTFFLLYFEENWRGMPIN